MKVWNKPSVREQEVGLEVTSYLPAEIDISYRSAFNATLLCGGRCIGRRSVFWTGGWAVRA